MTKPPGEDRADRSVLLRAGLDRESARLLEEVLPRYSPSEEMSAPEMRALALALSRHVQGEPPDIASVHDERIDSDGHQIGVRIYHPDPTTRPGCLVWLHGGGFVTGGLDPHDTLCRKLCIGSGLVVVAVAYRLAPEHPFPAAVRDSHAALIWAAENAVRVGARPGALAVGGSSAGGNLAAAACLMAREAGGPSVERQVLVYPVVDATMQGASYRTHATGYQLTAEMMAAYLGAYAPAGVDRRDPLLSPLHAPSLAGLPPAHVISAEFDPLHDEVSGYAARLIHDDVPVQFSPFSGVMHGFFGQAGVLSKARDAQRLVCEELKRAFGRGCAC